MHHGCCRFSLHPHRAVRCRGTVDHGDGIPVAGFIVVDPRGERSVGDLVMRAGGRLARYDGEQRDVVGRVTVKGSRL